VTTPDTSPEMGAPSGDPQGAPIPSFHPGLFETRFKDDSLARESERKIAEDDRESKRRIEEEDAKAHREVRKWFVKATIGTALGVSLLGAWITFNHQDPKARELGVSLISAPIAGLFGVLAGLGLK